GEERPGAKYYRWELLGAPLRLEVGAREAEKGTVTAVDRLGTKRTLGPGDLPSAVAEALRSFELALYDRALVAFRAGFTKAERLEDLAGSTTVRVVPWCGEEACGHRIETAIDGSLLGTPEGDLPLDLGTPGPCIACAGTGSTRWGLAAQPL
ncbi:MAG TPA: His/Gly/Thr/Pro-type tRNA ligase C-terminal domain-containing protein, partial [Thermoplasmata archaeon]